MYADHYYVDKTTGTYSDLLLAYGLGYVLDRALQDASVNSNVTILDLGTAYVLKLDVQVTQEMLAKATYPDELLPFIQDEAHSEGAKTYPLYHYRGLLASKSAGTAGSSDSEQAPMLEVPDDFNAFAIIEKLQGDQLWNRVAARLWALRKPKNLYPAIMEMALSASSTTPNTWADARSTFTRWRKENDLGDFPTDETQLAVFNPSAQKGINRPKPTGAENTNQSGFWMPEWLKMVGMPQCALAISVRSGTSEFKNEDKKIYVVAPMTISLNTHAAVLKTFRQSLYRSTSIKADIAAILHYVEAMLLYINRAHNRRRFGRSVANVVDGFSCAYFKKSGTQASAFSLTNLPFVQMPKWVTFEAVPTDVEIEFYQEIIKGCRQVIFFCFNDNGRPTHQLDEGSGEGCNLLHDFREFLSGNAFTGLLSFFSGFASLVMLQASKAKPYRQFDSSLVRRLITIMEPKLQTIMDDDGFLEVARAISSSTVYAQYLKARGEKHHHEIRYGLAQELRRKAPFKTEFTQAILEFINQYQAENARHIERSSKDTKVQKVHQITTSQVRRLAMLIDQCDGDSAEPVASLLLAFAYAFDDTRPGKKAPDELPANSDKSKETKQ